jgi:predicted dehydrogenase
MRPANGRAALDAWTNGRALHEASREPVGVAVIGYGYWGPNLARNVSERPELALAALCEPDPERALAFSQRHPDVRVYSDIDDVLGDPAVEAVVVATPPRTHHPLAKRALEAGRHVLVEKPLATTSADAAELVALADHHDLILMPGHTFVYSPAVNTIREMILDGVIGDIYFITSSRMNLGKYQRDGVVCDLAPHDLSILLYWLNEPIVQVAASARSVFQEGVPETAFLTLGFGGGATANVQVSWLAPRKVRQMVVVGSKRMVVYDDTASDEPVRVYDRGMDFSVPTNFGEYQLTYRSGDVVIPRIDAWEPLGLELQDFAHSIRTGVEPRSNAALGLQIVRALEAAEKSLRRDGHPILLHTAPERVAA